jgi:hypothetical protein
MKLATVVTLSILLGVLAHVAVTPLNAQQEPAAAQAPALNPLRVALLRWYPADHANATIPAGTSPGALAFDGSSMWIAGPSIVSKVRASDGQVLKTVSLTTGAGALVFDGANIWVSGSSITKLRASDGSVVSTVTIPESAGAMVFDGTNIWALLGFFPSGSVAKIRASDATLLQVVALTQVPESIAFDGANIWVGQGDGTTVATYGPFGPLLGMAFDGANMWIAAAGSVYKVRASDGTTVATYTFTGFDAISLVFDGSSMWVTSQVGNAVKKLRASDGTVLATVTLASPPNGITNVAFDGASVWVLAGNDAIKL